MSKQVLTCIAIDDEPRALKLIEKYCNQIPSVTLEHCFNNPIDAFNFLKYNLPDVIFVDIKMPEISGIQLVKNLEKKPFVVFTTAHSQYAVESYEIEATDYLLKPFDFDRFKQTIDKIKKLISLVNKPQETLASTEQKHITVMVEYKKVTISLDDILFIESMDNYIKIHTKNKCHIVLRSLKSMLVELPQEQFMQVHKSYIVSLSKIDSHKSDQITMGNNTIPIGRVFKPKFKNQIQN